MALDDSWIFCLAQDLKKVIVTDEVEAWEPRSLVLQEVGKCLLAPIKLVHHSLQRSPDVTVDMWVHKPEQLGVALNVPHDLAEIFIDALKPSKGNVCGAGSWSTE